jgi:hypothetical protein
VETAARAGQLIPLTCALDAARQADTALHARLTP